MHNADQWISNTLRRHFKEFKVPVYAVVRQDFLDELAKCQPPIQLINVTRMLAILADEKLMFKMAKEWRVHNAMSPADFENTFELLFAPLIAPLEALKRELARSLPAKPTRTSLWHRSVKLMRLPGGPFVVLDGDPDRWLDVTVGAYLGFDVVNDYDKAMQEFLGALKRVEPQKYLIIVYRLLEILSNNNLARAKAKLWDIYEPWDDLDDQDTFEYHLAPMIAPLEAMRTELEHSLRGKHCASWSRQLR